jgi:hypothetical protein
MAVQIAQLMAVIGADTRDLERGLQRGQSALNNFAGAAANVAQTAAGFLMRDVIVGGVNFMRESIENSARAMIEANATWETYTTQFEVQLGSIEAAQRRLAELEEFAMFAPGGLDDLIQADIIMQNFGLHAENAASRWGYSGQQIRQIAADMAAGTSGSFEEISTWLGRFAAGDTGRAIMRFQELGVVTRDQLRAMGVEFNKAGSLTTPVDQAFSALLRIAEEKFGGITQKQAQTLKGMQEQTEDWIAQQKRLWGEPIFDAYKEGLGGLLNFIDSEAGRQATSLAQGLWFSIVNEVKNIGGEVMRVFGDFAASALEYGAKFVEEWAAGVEGSDAVVRAMNSIAEQIRYWLEPGSPPRITPDLDKWGAGAFQAYMDGWVSASPEIGPRLQDAFKSLEPYLREIDLGGTFNQDMQGRFRESFGVESSMFEGYIRAYADLSEAAQTAAAAQEEYDEAVKGGDQETIDAAKKRLDSAQAEERSARQRLTAEQQRISERMQQEHRLTQAIQEQTRAIERNSRSSEDAERRKAEAEQKRINDARLQWELAGADTEGQLDIWQRELAGVAEGSAEYYQILTRIMQLEERRRQEAENDTKRLRDAQINYELAITDTAGQIGIWRRELEGVAEGSIEYYQIMTRIAQLEKQRGKEGGGIDSLFGGEDAAKEAEQYFHDSGAHMEQGIQKYDWGELGARIAQGLWQGATKWVKEKIDEETQKWADILSSPESLKKAAEIGTKWGHAIIDSIAEPFKPGGYSGPATLPDHIQQREENPLVDAARELGRAFADAFVEEIKQRWNAMGGLMGIIGIPADFAFTQKEIEMYRAELEASGIPAPKGGWDQPDTPGIADILSDVDKAGYKSLYGGYGYATGTRNFAGGWAIFGEDGPELGWMPGGSRILPNIDTEAALGGTTIYNTFNINVPGGDPHKVEIGVRKALRAAGVTA